MDISVDFAARALETVRAVAANEILPRYRSVVATIKHDGSLVTEADYAAQDALVRQLRALDPVPVIAEEMPSHVQLEAFAAAPRFWCVDPLDGTKNFSEGVPFFAVSVALVEDGRPLFGTVYDPIADEAFYAVRGGGAWLNNKPLTLSLQAPALAAAVAEVSLRRECAKLRNALKRHAPYLRRKTSGSAALSWCHLAAGRVDVLVSSGQKMWDYSAGALVLEEAGGSLCALDGTDYWSADVWHRSALAARTGALFDDWRAWILATQSAGDQ